MTCIINHSALAKYVSTPILISDFLVAVRVQAYDQQFLFASVYFRQARHGEEVFLKQWQELDGLLRQYRLPMDVVVLSIDANCKLGEYTDSTADEFMGPFSHGVRDDPGQHLVDFCMKHK